MNPEIARKVEFNFRDHLPGNPNVLADQKRLARYLKNGGLPGITIPVLDLLISLNTLLHFTNRSPKIIFDDMVSLNPITKSGKKRFASPEPLIRKFKGVVARSKKMGLMKKDIVRGNRERLSITPKGKEVLNKAREIFEKYPRPKEENVTRFSEQAAAILEKIQASLLVVSKK